ncbi:DUF1631 family protein [Caenimonas aquaedulcis]|uniref:DUF1631 family protein n=1 Tax=Caenimonas aquaedulcis TaxID=2793270 RepID=A0A931MHN0_9BURK|nr:DUF1631 family protein [Caenimonas aquaedulcis]MBG9389251.1 DUF1631 family protein [Caenimonas aquaedulcis]
MAELPAIVRPCIDEAVAQSARMIARAIDHAGALLDEELRKGGPAIRHEAAAAARALPALRVAWCGAFPSALRESLLSNRTARTTAMASPSSLTLTLVDEDEVLQSIEASRLAQQLASATEQALAELDTYMSSALQLDGIQPELNPLRPALVAQALRKVVGETPEAPAALWLRLMAEPLAADLKAIYKTCSRMLAASNVRAAGYRVVTGPAPLSPSRPAPLQAAPPAPGVISGWVELAARAIGAPALRDFLFGAAPHAQQPLAPTYYQQVDQELAELEARWDEAPPDPDAARRYQHLPAVDRPAREVGTDSPLNREVWGAYAAPRQRSLVRTRLRKQAKQLGQVMGLDVVNQLIGQVAQDPRLLAPVRESIVALEPSLARLAMHSPRFFAEQQNPARQLLEAVAQRSFKFNDEFSSEFQAFLTEVTASFNALNQVEALDDAHPFESELARLSKQWARQDEAEESQRRQLVQEVEIAEQRQAAADQIAWDLSQRSDLDGVPSVVQDFIFGPWTLVIAHARIASGGTQIDPGGYTGVVTDLLWSVKRELTLRDPARAFEALPRVLSKLREGLDLLGHPPSETETFFKALERLHRPVMKLRAKQRGLSLRDDLAGPVDDDLRPAPAQKPQAREEMWLREAELRACGFEDTLPSDYAELEPAARRPSSPTAAPASASVTPIAVTRAAGVALAPAQADAIIESIAEGSLVDLFSKQRWHRARLSWVSTRRQLFMFVSHGGRPHSMTRRSLRALVVNRLLRPVDAHDVVQHALDALAQPRAEPLAA